MVTLSDVAKEAHVSKMTVSRVINHPEKVTNELREAVFNAMKKLNYQPNIAARALASNKTRIIKLFVLEEMSTVEPYYMTLLTGISKELEKYSYTLQLSPSLDLNNGICDGYIITGVRENDFSKLDNIKKPIVLFGENTHGYDYIDNDNYNGVKKATEYAFECGYDNFVYVGINEDEPFEQKRGQGYTDVMQERGKIPQIIRCANRSHLAEQIISDELDTYPKNTVFICSSDRLALGVQKAIVNKRFKIGEDYGVIGHDGVFLDQIGDLTTIKQSILEMGSACVQLLLRKINQEDITNIKRVYKSELVVRKSTRKI